MKFPRLVDNDFLVEFALTSLIVEIYDELVAKGWAIRNDRPDGEVAIDWTEEGRRQVPAETEMAFFVDALLQKVLSLKARIREGSWPPDAAVGASA